MPASKQQQLLDAYGPCIEVLEELDKLLLHYNGLDTKTKRAWDRLTFDPDTLQQLRERLVASVAMLNTFYTSLLHDVQVQILEALERLERDYRGGHREESIASIERLTLATPEEDSESDDEAWRQIIRDLEDVGISPQQAFRYRDVIVDWLITAVNEGRLVEVRPEHDAVSSLSQDLETQLPEIEAGESFTGLDPPTIASSPAETRLPRSLRTPPPPSIPRPPIPPSHVSATASVTSRVDSVASLPTMPQDVDSDHSSLYADPERPSPPTPSVRSNTSGVSRPPVPHMGNSLQTSPQGPPAVPLQQAPPVPVLPLDSEMPPSYFDKGITLLVDMNWTAHQTVAAWTRRDFVTAERHLQDQLAAVERGQTSASGASPDPRILKHLLAACASLTGKFPKAKQLFESVFQGSLLARPDFDEGDIAAARWLGDICLHTQEHVNALLAYSVAYEGSVARFGATSDRTRRVAMEIILLDHWLWGFKRIEGSLSLNLDPTSIFASADVVEKNKLLMNVKKSVYELARSTSTIPASAPSWGRPSYSIGPRPRYEMRLSEGFLLNPLLSLSTWPLPWDPLFSPTDTVQLDRYMNTVRFAKNLARPLHDRQLPTNSLGDSKRLHFLTKRGSRWLINAVERGLDEMGIAHAQHCFETSIVCCLNQQREGIACSEGVEIRLSKLPFRDVHGIKVTDVRWATRRIGSGPSDAIASKYRSTADFRDMVKGILDRAEAEADGRPERISNMYFGGSGEYYLQAPHASPYEKRRMYS